MPCPAFICVAPTGNHKTMTSTDNPTKEPSINDNLPNGNPSLRTVLLFFGALVALAAILVLYMEYVS